MDEKLRNKFKEVVRMTLEVEGIEATPESPYLVTFSRTLFMVCFGLMKKQDKISQRTCQSLWNEFPKILKELNIKIRGKALKECKASKLQISDKMRKGAREREHYFQKQLGSDY